VVHVAVAEDKIVHLCRIDTEKLHVAGHHLGTASEIVEHPEDPITLMDRDEQGKALLGPEPGTFSGAGYVTISVDGRKMST
jgi:hypothetical protein